MFNNMEKFNQNKGVTLAKCLHLQTEYLFAAQSRSVIVNPHEMRKIRFIECKHGLQTRLACGAFWRRPVYT